MITAIANIGRALREESEIEALVDRTNAKAVLVLKFTTSGDSAKYTGIDIEKKREDELYLYRRDPAGRGAGLFLTGRIGRFDLQALGRNLRLLSKDPGNKEGRKSKDDFLTKKLDWFTRGGIIRDESLLATLSQRGRTTLDSVIDEFKNHSENIHDDFLNMAKTLEPEEMLVTIKIADGLRECYVGQLPEYVEVFRLAVTRVAEEEKTTGSRASPACTICNKPGVTAKFRQPPLPFVTTDKPGFLPQGDREQTYKVFPLCSDCFMDLRRGWKFIERHLAFSILPIEGRRSEVNFWLIPVPPDPKPVMDLISNLGARATQNKGREGPHFLYLKNLGTICTTMDYITADVSEENSEAPLESYLTFTALFFTRDSKGHMRLILRSEGIYPKRLKFIIEVKRKVDSLYPFEKLGVRFGFPLLREFLAPSRKKRGKVPEAWYKDLSSILSSMFTGTPLDKQLFYKAVTRRIQEQAKEADPRAVADVSYRALSLIQYVEHLQPHVVGEERF